MVILVTGGSGFLGSHIVDKLIERHYEVRVFEKAKPLQSNVEWVKGDLTNQQDVLDACTDVETVFHLGAVADVNVALSHPENCILVNEIGTLNVLRACTAKDLERMVLASTTWVYGENSGEVTEETLPPPPNHVYTKTKIGQEQLVYAWGQTYGLPYTILRYDIPYGPRMRGNMAIAIFVRRAMQKEPITIYGNGDQGRCWIYAEDLAEASIHAMTESARNQVINIAGDRFVTIKEIVEELKKIFGTLTTINDSSRTGDFKGVKVNIEKAKKLLGWTPQTPFPQGIRRYIESLTSSHA